jgi:DNA-binding transcriptional ArsR family regulator
MSRGIGGTQRAILDTLESVAEQFRWLTIADLAERLGRSDRQIRSAVRSLEGRGLVKDTREQVGWKGWGESGPLIQRGAPGWPDDSGVPTAGVAGRQVWEDWRWVYRKVEMIHAGMPVFGLGVSLPGDPENLPAWMRNADEAGRLNRR